MKNWCKIIPLKNHDVLVERISNDEDGEAVRASWRLDGIHPSTTLGFTNNVGAADKAYEQFNSEVAEEFVTGFYKMIIDGETES